MPAPEANSIEALLEALDKKGVFVLRTATTPADGKLHVAIYEAEVIGQDELRVNSQILQTSFKSAMLGKLAKVMKTFGMV